MFLQNWLLQCLNFPNLGGQHWSQSFRTPPEGPISVFSPASAFLWWGLLISPIYITIFSKITENKVVLHSPLFNIQSFTLVVKCSFGRFSWVRCWVCLCNVRLLLGIIILAQLDLRWVSLGLADLGFVWLQIKRLQKNTS